MHRSSESIASLAAALAKAQVLLTNPEKSLTATVGSDRYDEPGRTFRYAPLSSGLDIVRKALGQHEIATMQTTAIDQAAQAVSLTTVLAHSSGEWIASDWPVCALSEMATPRRMGAALTYARRYALFTLVGIAGEEDLDAPDLAGQPAERSGSVGDGANAGKANEGGPAQTFRSFSANRKPWSPPKPALEPEKSAALRDQLLGELGSVATQEEATAWAQGALGAKNTLTTADSGLVEAAFAARLAELAEVTPSGAPLPASGAPKAACVIAPTPENAASNAVGQRPRKKRRRERSPSAGLTPTGKDENRLAAEFADAHVNNAVDWHIDKNALALSEPRRYRDREHLRFVSLQPCLVCGRRPTDAHHLRFTQPRALGRRVSDEFAVPLCRTHHRALHRRGDEAAWWREANLEPVVIAGRLWAQTRVFNRAPIHRTAAPLVSDNGDIKPSGLVDQ
jgi:hypothetical protein